MMDATCDAFKLLPRTSRYFENPNLDPNSNENKNTKRKTETDMRIFTAYLVSLNETREPEEIPPAELDRHLATYFSIIKKHDGNEYEPASLRGMLCSIERYLRSKNYPISLTRDVEFINTRNMLKEKQKILRELAKNEKTEKQDSMASLAVQRLNQLYLAKEFGPHNATSVVNALCFSFVVHLKIKKAIDHKQLLWGDIALCKSQSDEEYLCYKPLTGFEYCRMPLKGISCHRVCFQSQDTPLWDPIAIYKLYSSRRPVSMMSPGSPFYLGVSISPQEPGQQSWYKPVAMGVNKLNDLVRMIRDITGSLPTNHTFLAPYEHPDIPEVSRSTDNIYPATTSIHSSERHSPTNCLADHASMYDHFLKNESDVPRDENSFPPNDEEQKSFSFNRNGVDRQEPVPGVTKSDDNAAEVDADVDAEANNVLGGEEHASLGENDETESDRDSNEFEMAKQKVLTILANLDVDSKQEIVDWLKRIYFDKGTGDIRESDNEKMKIEVSLDVDRDSLTSGEVVLSTATVNIKPISKTPGSYSPPDKDQFQSPFKPSLDSNITTISSEKVWQSLPIANKARLNSASSTLKRAASCPDESGQSPVCKTRKTENTSKEEEKVTEELEDVPEKTESQLSYAMSSEKLLKPEYSINTPMNPQYPVLGAQTNVPYTSWPYDPRLAFLLRNDFVQTYQNLIEMYNSGASKPTG